MANRKLNKIIVVLLIFTMLNTSVFAATIPKKDISLGNWKKTNRPVVRTSKFDMTVDDYKDLQVLKTKDMYFTNHTDVYGLTTLYTSKDMKIWTPILKKESNAYLNMLGLESGFSFVFHSDGYYILLSFEGRDYDNIYRSKDGYDWEINPIPKEIKLAEANQYLDFYKKKPALILGSDEGKNRLVANIYRFNLAENKLVYEATDPKHEGGWDNLELLTYYDFKVKPSDWLIKEKINETNIKDDKSTGKIDNKDDIKIIINGKLASFEKNPFIEKGRTLVPLRGIFETLGADVDWDGNYNIVKAYRNNIVIKLQIDNPLLSITESGNAKFEKIDVPPKIKESTTFVPIRAVSQSFGADIDWDEDTKTITINSKDQVYPRDYGGHGSLEKYLDSRNFETILSGLAQVEFPAHNEYKEPLLPVEVLGKNFMKNIKMGKTNPKYPNIGNSNRKNKKTTGIAIFDETIDYIEKDIIKGNMTDKEVIKKVYDFVIYNFKHDNNFSFSERYNDLRKYYHGEYLRSNVSGDGFALLYNKSGVCDNYASLLNAILNRLGFESEVDGGYYVNKNGSKYPHAWVKVKLNNTWYYLDPDIESTQIQKGKTASYQWFLKTEKEWKSNHQW